MYPKNSALAGRRGPTVLAKHLPAAILERHRLASAELHTRLAEHRRLVKAVEHSAGGKRNVLTRVLGQGAADPVGLRTAFSDLAQFHARHPNKRPHTASDPKQLPWGSPKPLKRAPHTSRAQFQLSGLFPDATVKLAQLGSALPALPAQAGPTPTADDLAATPDIQLTPALRAKAQELGDQPLSIHQWVRNTIDFVPSYGSMQGADLTLQTQRGNAFDIASLEIALLRAAGIPARYVYGTIELPAARAMNWVGGATAPEAALDLLGQGGIPSLGIVAGGKIDRIRLEHVWDEAWIDYIPSRGAKHGRHLDSARRQLQAVRRHARHEPAGPSIGTVTIFNLHSY